MPPTTLGDLRRQRRLSVAEVAQACGCSIGFIQQIERHAQVLAPNHPIIEKLAESLGMSVPEVQTFAKHEPYTQGQIKLALFRMARGRDNRGGDALPRAPKALPAGEAEPNDGERVNKEGQVVAVQPKPRLPKRTSRHVASLAALSKAQGFTRGSLANALGVSRAMIDRVVLNSLGLAPNHPIIPKVAKTLGVAEEEVRRHARKKTLSHQALLMIDARMGKPSPAAATYRARRHFGAQRGNKNPKETWASRRRREKAEAMQAERERRRDEKLAAKAAKARGQPGTALVRVKQGAVERAVARNERDEKRAYNALRLMDKDTRQCARSLATATVLAALKGNSHVDVAVPTADLANLLNYLFGKAGMEVPVVIGKSFDELFG